MRITALLVSFALSISLITGLAATSGAEGMLHIPVSSQDEITDLLIPAIEAFDESISLDMSSMKLSDTDADMTIQNAYFNAISKKSELKYAYEVQTEYDSKSKTAVCTINYMPYKLGKADTSVPGTLIIDSVHSLIDAAINSMGKTEVPIAITNKELDYDIMQLALDQAGGAFIVFSLNRDATKLTAAPAVDYTMDESISYVNQTDELAKEIINEIITPGMRQKEKVYAAYRYVTENVEYDEIYYSNPLEMPYASRTAYGAFKDKTAICGGFSLAFKTLMDNLDIECYNVSGFSFEEHMWNLVEIDGAFYYLDTTLDRGQPKDIDSFYSSEDQLWYTWNKDLTSALTKGATATGPPAIGGFKDSPRSVYGFTLFNDVDENLWYGANKQGVIKNAFELQIMDGKGNGKFDPTGKLSVGEAIKMATCVNHIYSGGSANDFIQGSPWYQIYVNHAISKGIIRDDDFNDYTRPVTRGEMAYIFSNSVPAGELKAINSIGSLPDVDETAHKYGENIFALYRAGIITGNDSQGTFTPESQITRAEAAAIIVRVILPDERFTLDFS